MIENISRKVRLARSGQGDWGKYRTHDGEVFGVTFYPEIACYTWAELRGIAEELIDAPVDHIHAVYDGEVCHGYFTNGWVRFEYGPAIRVSELVEGIYVSFDKWHEISGSISLEEIVDAVDRLDDMAVLGKTIELFATRARGGAEKYALGTMWNHFDFPVFVTPTFGLDREGILDMALHAIRGARIARKRGLEMSFHEMVALGRACEPIWEYLPENIAIVRCYVSKRLWRPITAPIPQSDELRERLLALAQGDEVIVANYGERRETATVCRG